MIYLDHNATTPVLPEVLEAMMPYLSTEWGNPSSSYKFGSKLKTVIETARDQVAELIGAHPRDVIFTSCATESNNAAIHAALKANPNKRHIVTSAVEHSSVLNYCMALEKEGYCVSYLPVDRDGLLKPADLENAITAETSVVSLMWANNETGVLFPVKEKRFPLPPFSPLIHGGHQERNLRGGTESVPLIVGMGKAAELSRRQLPDYEKKVRPLRDKLEEGILSSIPNTELNGHKMQRLANTTNITFHDVESEALLILLDQEGICASSGSACLADSDEPSHVVKAMKPKSAASRQMIRFSLDTGMQKADVAVTLQAMQRTVDALRG